MKYGDLIQLGHMERLAGGRVSASEEVSRQLVLSYVMSEGVARSLSQVIFPNLRLDAAPDVKPLLVMGGGGTGKSHLLSVIAGLAESPDLFGSLSGRKLLKRQDEVIAGEGSPAGGG